MAPRNDTPRNGVPRNGAPPRGDHPARDRSILLGSFPTPLRRGWGIGLLGLTLWLAGVIALFHF